MNPESNSAAAMINGTKSPSAQAPVQSDVVASGPAASKQSVGAMGSKAPTAVPPHGSDSFEKPSMERLAQLCCPELMMNEAERFQLDNFTVVVHPDRPLIAYHMVWADDYCWPGFDNTDHEVIWVEHDGKQPTKVYTYFHGRILEKELAPGEKPEVRMQFGFHGCLPKGDQSFARKAWDFIQFIIAKLPIRDLLFSKSQPRFKSFEGSYKDFLSATKPANLSFDPKDLKVTKNGNAEVSEAINKQFSEHREVQEKIEWPE